MKILLILLSVLLLCTYGHSQMAVIWTQEYDSGSSDVASDIKVDGIGNVYVTGRNETINAYYTIKYDSQGNTIWTQQYYLGIGMDIGRGIALDKDNNVYVTGESATAGGGMYGTIKYDQFGNSIWTQYFSLADQDLYGYDVAVDPLNNVYVTGLSISNSKNIIYTIKFDSSGSAIWTQRYGTNVEGWESIALDDFGFLYVGGSVEFSGANWAFVTLKYDCLSGQVVWTQIYDGPDNEVAHDIVVDNNNNVYVTGKRYNGYYDYFTVKYDSLGNTIWTQQYSTGNVMCAYGIIVDKYDYVYVTGRNSNGFNYDYYTIKYDFLGNIQWTYAYDGGGFDTAYAVAVDEAGYVYLTGYKESAGNNNYFTVKYLQAPYPYSLSLSIERLYEANRVILRWEDHFINKTGYKIYRKDNNTFFKIIARLSSDIHSYTDNDLNDLSTYQYKITATNSAGESVPSNTVTYTHYYNTASINDVKLVPNPFHLQKSAKSYMTFYKVPTGTKITVYSVSGEEMIHLDQIDEEHKIIWNVCDNRNKLLPRGLYIAKIINKKGDSRVIKFVVEY